MEDIVLTTDTIEELELQLSYVFNDESLALDVSDMNQVLDYCTKLILLLNKYDNSLKLYESYPDLQSIYNNLLNSINIAPLFSLNTNHFEYYMLSHLCTSLQTFRILAYNKNK